MDLTEEVIRLRKQGFSYNKTAEKLGKSRDYIRDICRENGVSGVMATPIEKKCGECGDKVISHNGLKKYCSEKCFKKADDKKKINNLKLYSCDCCGKEYTVKTGYSRSYCSGNCFNKENTHKCEWCNRDFVKENNSKNKFCSERCKVKRTGILKTKNAISKPKPINRLKKFMEELLEAHDGKLLPAGDFNGLCEPMRFVCLICEETHQKAEARYAVTRGCNCMTSIGEAKVRSVLNKNKINFEQQYIFKNCRNINPLPFDFAIIEKDEPVMLIEYDGKHHYEPVKRFGGEENLLLTKKNDEIKTEYAKRNNLLLIRIPYWEQNNIEEILLNAFAMA